MKLSCVILNYRDADRVLELVDRICGYSILSDIILVDNASADGSFEKLEERTGGLEKVHVIQADENGGYGAGNNLGVRYGVEQCGATHVVIANPDVDFSEDCLKKMVRVFAHHPDVAAAAASIEDARLGRWRNGWPLRGFVGELLSVGPVSRRLFRRFLEYPDSRFCGRKAAFVDALHGSMLMVDAEKFLECGGYDEGLFLYQEEAVLGWRLKTGGYRSVLLLNCSYRHEHSASIGKTFQGQLERQRLREKSLLYYMKQYLFIHPLQEAAAKLWFGIIRLEIRAANGLMRLKGVFCRE